MSYEPFALKYRPQVFADTVGQEAVATTLRNAIREDRVANAFLFSGSRGVGKTSMARILCKALNCPEAKDGEPCGRCERCVAIAGGQDSDVIEIDGASNRGIDEIRTIRDNVGYAPSQGRYKIYVIDEVHMLTMPAFNALLKTLEEPPPHVKFIFATTEFQAVPETIVSRCQRYEFRRIGVDDIVRRLAWIAEREGVAVEEAALREIASKAEGGLRDSTALLDQVISFAGETIAIEDVDRVVGSLDHEIVRDLVIAAGEGDPAAVLDALDRAFESGRDAEDVLEQTTGILRAAMVRTARGLRGGGEGRQAELIATVRERFDLDRLLFAIRVLLNARREARLVGHGRLQLELACLKICRSKDLLPVKQILEIVRSGGGGEGPGRSDPSGAPARAQDAKTVTPGASARRAGPPPAQQPSRRPASSAPAPRPAAPRSPAPVRRAPPPPEPEAPRPAPAPPASQRPQPTLELVRGEWGRFLDRVRESSVRLASQLEPGVPTAVQGAELLITLPASARFPRQQLEGPQRRAVEDLLEQCFGHRLVTRYQLADSGEGSGGAGPRRQVNDDPGVRKIIDSFDGGIIAVDNEESQ